jgi:hypothetical protein
MVEIIPKPVTRASSWQNIPFYFSVGLILLAVLSYFIVDIYINRAESKLTEIEERMAQTKSVEQTALEKELSDYEKKIEGFSILAGQHLFSSKAFEFVEKNTHPEVWFSDIKLTPSKGEIVLSGDTENFITLRQQAQIFKSNPLVKNLDLTKIAIGKEGRIDFSVNLILDLNLFKLNE